MYTGRCKQWLCVLGWIWKADDASQRLHDQFVPPYLSEFTPRIARALANVVSAIKHRSRMRVSCKPITHTRPAQHCYRIRHSYPRCNPSVRSAFRWLAPVVMPNELTLEERKQITEEDYDKFIKSYPDVRAHLLTSSSSCWPASVYCQACHWSCNLQRVLVSPAACK